VGNSVASVVLSTLKINLEQALKLKSKLNLLHKSKWIILYEDSIFNNHKIKLY